MDIGNAFKALSDAMQQTRRGYHLTLGFLIAALAASHEDKPVYLDRGRSVDHPHSYRGYYEDLALRPSGQVRTTCMVR